jgi:hypothetical protein
MNWGYKREFIDIDDVYARYSNQTITSKEE